MNLVSIQMRNPVKIMESTGSIGESSFETVGFLA